MPEQTKTTTDPIKDAVQKLMDSRTDLVGDTNKPKSLVETFWLDRLAELLGVSANVF